MQSPSIGRGRMRHQTANANLFSPGAVCWSRDSDISKRYLANVIDGCYSGLHGGEQDQNHPKRFKT
eukprot:838063-Rhodomonas_salina.1